jgi:hypothetical protein
MKRIVYLSILLLGAFVLLFGPAVGAQEEQGVVPVAAYDGYFYPADITVGAPAANPRHFFRLVLGYRFKAPTSGRRRARPTIPSTRPLPPDR